MKTNRVAEMLTGAAAMTEEAAGALSGAIADRAVGGRSIGSVDADACDAIRRLYRALAEIESAAEETS